MSVNSEIADREITVNEAVEADQPVFELELTEIQPKAVFKQACTY